ncbi:UNVERIFIED_CONTAM: hypothetical protein DVV46_10880, partial [Lactobacillus paragasseri]|nr:hypothetical protein [Lactobacillus paragasseri]
TSDQTKYIRWYETATNSQGSASQASNISGPVGAAASGSGGLSRTTATVISAPDMQRVGWVMGANLQSQLVTVSYGMWLYQPTSFTVTPKLNGIAQSGIVLYDKFAAYTLPADAATKTLTFDIAGVNTAGTGGAYNVGCDLDFAGAVGAINGSGP